MNLRRPLSTLHPRLRRVIGCTAIGAVVLMLAGPALSRTPAEAAKQHAVAVSEKHVTTTKHHHKKHHHKKHHHKHKHRKHHHRKHHGRVSAITISKPAVKPAPKPSTAPSPTSTPTATSTTVPAVATDPIDPTATGVPAATRLTVHQGDINITQAGTVIDGLDVRGAIKVNAPNVTIKNSIIRFRSGGYTVGIQSYSTGLKITDVEIAPSTSSPDYNGVMGSGFTMTRTNIHGVIDSVHIYGDNVTIRDSWLHDNMHYVNDPNWGGKGSHDDSIQIVKGRNITITGSTYSGAYNSGIQITQDSGTVANVTVSGNHVDGGGCTINVAEKGGGPIQGISITDNVFGGHQRVDNCGIIRPTTTTVAASDNVWATTGGSVALRRG